MAKLTRRRFQVIGAALLFLTPVGAAIPSPQTPNACVDRNNSALKLNSYSPRQERDWGALFAKEAERSSKIVDDAEATNYLNRLAAKLSQNSSAPFPIQVKIVDSDVANELVLPGGFLYVNKGLILQAETEAELAGALAYGLAHTSIRSGTQVMTRGALFESSTIGHVTGHFLWIDSETLDPLELGAPIELLFVKRRFVLAADCLSLKYLASSGYDSDAIVRFVERVSPKSTSQSKKTESLQGFSPI